MKVRFHLARGKNYKQWQIKDKNGNVHYFKPEEVNLIMYNCKLHNSAKVAAGIYSGKEKTVCSWIECDGVEVLDSKVPNIYDIIVKKEIFYNPKVAPYWRDGDKNIDGKKFETLVTKNRGVFKI